MTPVNATRRSTNGRRGRAAGFTLLELMIVVAIIAIIAGFAYPSYMDSIRKSRRSDGKAAIQAVAQRLEQWYIDRKTYVIGTLSDLGFTPTAGDYLSPEGYYIVTVASALTTYTITATARNDQANDKPAGCTALTLNQRGDTGPAGCW